MGNAEARRVVEEIDERIERLLAEHPPAATPDRELWGAQFDLGLAWVHFPEGAGGLGVDPKLQERVDDALRAVGAPSNVNVNFMLVGMAGPTLTACGTDEQRARFLRPGFACEEIWCQLFSEPGAGSDLASLATRAVRDGDEWTFDGQKVWTTLAHVADWAMVLARTDPDVPKHKGLTYFLIDMHQPGIEVRPLRQMNGEAEFNEVYLTGARTPDALRVGEVGDGWRVATATLMNERVAFGHLAKAPRGTGPIGVAVEAFRRSERSPVARDRLMKLWIDNELVRLTTLRAQQQRERGTPGPEGSVIKLAYSVAAQRTYELANDLRGAEGMLIRDYEMVRPTTMGGSVLEPDGIDLDIAKAMLTTRGTTIGGGTTDIGRNVIGERVLGLPSEPRTDSKLPWSQVPRS